MILRTSFLITAVACLAGAASCTSAGRGRMDTALPDSAAIRRDVAYLASDALEGRATGSAGNDSAAAYIARRFQALGLQPLLCDTGAAQATRRIPIGAAIGVARGDTRTTRAPRPRIEGKDCRGTYLQSFSTRSVAAAHAGVMATLTTQNVVAVVRGIDATLRDEYLVIGAHFDHLGRMGFGVMDPDSASAIHNGADDNASGTAAVLELARLLASRPAARSVVFVTFSGEELGLLGSQYFVDHPPMAIGQVVAMLNFDMVGRLKDERLIVYGVATADEFAGMLDSANVAPRFQLTATGDGFGASDHSSFYAKNLPVLHFFTDVHRDYHRSTDDVASLNASGEARVVAMAERVLRTIANRPSRLTFRRPAAPAARMSTCRNNDVSLGSIPNMGASDVGGLQLSGVREGSPAQKGGLAAGDIVVEFGGMPVKDIYMYTDALCNHRPGDTVKVVVRRNGELVTLSVTLGKRGS